MAVCQGLTVGANTTWELSFRLKTSKKPRRRKLHPWKFKLQSRLDIRQFNSGLINKSNHKAFLQKLQTFYSRCGGKIGLQCLQNVYLLRLCFSHNSIDWYCICSVSETNQADQREANQCDGRACQSRTSCAGCKDG